jgi:hypothetical protein
VGRVAPAAFGPAWRTASLASTAPDLDDTITFTALSAGSLRAIIGTDSNDNIGPLLTAVTLATLATIPEPASWSLMILGFGGAGAILRRRRTAAGAST